MCANIDTIKPELSIIIDTLYLCGAIIMNTKWLAVHQLDNQLFEWQVVSKKYNRPPAGWVKTIRRAIGMSVEQLAERLGVKRARVAQLENAEPHDAVTLRTLRAAADAMGCELVYAIIPKDSSTLHNIIKNRAMLIAKAQIENVADTMTLEAQSVEPEFLEKQKNARIKALMDRIGKSLWAHEGLNKTLSEALDKKFDNDRYKKLVANLQKKNNNEI